MIKEKVKDLWRLCFDDSEAFIEMYFRLRYDNGANIAIESGEEVISALQMIPYPMTYCGKTVATAYISGACTHPDYRGNGVMRQLLSQAFSRMYGNDVMFSTLIPAEPWLYGYYSRMGYAPVFNYSERMHIPSPETKRIETGSTTESTTGYRVDAYQYLSKKLAARACCIQHTPADFKVILADLELTGDSVFISRQNNLVTGIAVAYNKEDAVYIDELIAEDTATEHLILLDIGRATGYKKQIIVQPPAGQMPRKELGMARMIHVKETLALFASAFPETTMNIALTDEQLPANDGYYYLSEGKCRFSYEKLSGNHLQLTISELTTRILAPLHPYMSLMMN